jgi:hypothetical protein
MATLYYKPVKKSRYFNKDKRYSEIDWNDFNVVVQEFRERINVWYIEPIKALQKCGDHSFPVAGLTCLLIDALSQYFPQPMLVGPKPSGHEFKEFIKNYLPRFAEPLPAVITHYRHDSGRSYVLHSLQDVIYHAYRCGILHEAHCTLYAGIYGLNGKRFKFYKAKCTKYANGRKCLTVAIDPHLLFRDTILAFDRFIINLLDPNPVYQPWRDQFKQKFLTAFGIDIENEKP